VPGAELLGEPDRAGDVDAGRAAELQALVLDDVAADANRLFVGDMAGKVDRLADVERVEPQGEHVRREGGLRQGAAR
jgi:hypothetical protein